MRRQLVFAGLILALAGGWAVRARADATLLLEDPINFEGRVTSAGHATLWMDRLCSDDHLHMRLCRAGEAGAVVGRYPNLNGHLDWLAISPSAYLFAVDREDEIPASVDAAEFMQLQARYRAEHGASFAVDPGAAGWTQLLGESYRRRIVLLRVKTTEEQEVRLMDWLNERRNRSHFHLFYGNCADFLRQALDVMFPGAERRSVLFDAGIMTPKQLGSSLHGYAIRHSELGFEAMVLPQAPGSIKRSGHLRGVTEAYLKNWWFLLPLDALDPIELGAVTALGVVDRRYRAKDVGRVEDGEFFGGDTSVSHNVGSGERRAAHGQQF